MRFYKKNDVAEKNDNIKMFEKCDNNSSVTASKYYKTALKANSSGITVVGIVR